jgi:hypothetical protein
MMTVKDNEHDKIQPQRVPGVPLPSKAELIEQSSENKKGKRIKKGTREKSGSSGRQHSGR